MTRREMENRVMIIRRMCSTAMHNGKECSYPQMARLADRLHRIETTLQRLAVDQCMYDTYDWAKQERLERLAESLIRENIGCRCYTQRDPRGYAIRMYLVDEGGRKWNNVFDGETTGLAW